MAERTVEKEVQDALECIDKNQNFILTGGAGSGKTYTLISLIEALSIKYPQKKIACITFTNNAVSEVRSRISNSNLTVSTIHEFIWGIISKFQNELKITIIELVNDKAETLFKLPKEITDGQSLDITFFGNYKIEYGEYYSLKSDRNSVVSHDHLLAIAERMFEKYPKLCDVLKDLANFIFVDEYQDTSKRVVNIFTKHINQSSKDCVIGFFGDAMQAIYDSGIGDIDNESLIRINKTQNRRNPNSVIELTNQLRDDKIIQKPSTDNNAPNMLNGDIITGSVKFIAIKNLEVLDELKKTDHFLEWDFSNGEEVKELYLTHKYNARQAGFKSLYELYNEDLIFELIKRIREKIKEGAINPEGKVFNDIVTEGKITKGRKELFIDKINENKILSRYYENLKSLSWDDVSKLVINKDSLFSYKVDGITGEYEASAQRDRILKRLDSIFELLDYYQRNEYNLFLRKTKFKIRSLSEKKKLYENMKKFNEASSLSIGEIINLASEFKIIYEDEKFITFINNQGKYLWERIKDISYDEYVNSINYQNAHLPFATQHSIKGSEYDNVLVVLDNGEWNKYDFRTLFGLGSTNENVKKRTKKLFYVSCTRAKQNLTVVMPTDDSEIIQRAYELFGKENVVIFDS